MARRGLRSRCIRCTESVAPAARPTGGSGEQHEGGGEQRRIAGSGGRVVGVQLHQPGYLLFGVPHQRQEREHLAADQRHGQQPVMTAGGQVRPPA